MTVSLNCAAAPFPSAADDLDSQVAQLKTLRNAVIGSRTRKGQLVVQGKVPELVALIHCPLHDSRSLQVRSIVATILGSLAHSGSSPTLLSLLRAGASDALCRSLVDLAAAPGSGLPCGELEVWKALEAILRALRSFMVAFAAEVSPNSRLGLGPGRDSIGASSSRLRARSSREPAGWDMAEAGFTRDGPEDVAMAAATSSTTQATDAASEPLEDLTTLARAAIAALFSSTTLPMILGPLFLFPIPRHERMDQTMKEAKSAALAKPSRLSPGSSVGLGNDGSTKAESHIGTPVANTDDETSAGPSSSASSSSLAARGSILTYVEMISGILSACLNVPGPGPETLIAAASGKRRSTASHPKSPEQEVIARRQLLHDFRAEDSPYTLAETTRRTSASRQQSLLEVLLEAAECGFPKAQEAALWALAELTRDNADTSVKLFGCHTPSGLLPTSMLLSLRKDPNAHIRLAAFSCMANIIKVHPFTAKTNERVLAVLVELLDHPGDLQTAAAFAIAKVVADDPELQVKACGAEYECMKKLAFLLDRASKALSTTDASARSSSGFHFASRVKLMAAEEAAHRLREAVLTALAALTFGRDEVRRQLIDAQSPALLPMIVPCLSSSALGTRIAACRLVRALSRSISILRTSLVDAGIAEKLVAILQDDREDPEVQTQATATICNLVLSFSPMREYLSEKGGIAKLVDLCSSPHGPTRFNALWAVKNVLYASETQFKADVMRHFGYEKLAQLVLGQGPGRSSLGDEGGPIDAPLATSRENRSDAKDEQDSVMPDKPHHTDDGNANAVQEQALNIVRNLISSREEDIEQTMRGFGGPERFFELIEAVIWQRGSVLVQEQAAYILVNVATGNTTHRHALLQRANLMDALCFFLSHPRAEVRVAAVWTAMNLTQHSNRSATSTEVDKGTSGPSGSGESVGSEGGPHRGGAPADIGQEAVAMLRRFGFDERLKELRFDPERDVSDRARALIRRFD